MFDSDDDKVYKTHPTATAAAVAANVEDEDYQAKENAQHIYDWIKQKHENVSKIGKKFIKITPELRKATEIQISALIKEKNIVVTEEGESII